jgi:hypothetical protein
MPTAGSQLLEAGNLVTAAPHRASGRTGTLTGLSAGNPVATLINFGMLRDDGTPSGSLVNTPIRVSQIRLKYAVVTTPATNGVAFEIVRGTATTQHSSGGNLRAALRRKTSGYDAIPTSQVSLYVSDTGVISGGNFAALNDNCPLDMMTEGPSTGLDGGSLVWEPGDMHGETLELGEALEVRARQFSGTGILLVAFDFLR